MMTTDQFHSSVREIAGPGQYNEYKYVLSSVLGNLRERYITTLRKGFRMNDSLFYLHKGSKLPETNYNRFINYCRLIRDIGTI